MGYSLNRALLWAMTLSVSFAGCSQATKFRNAVTAAVTSISGGGSSGGNTGGGNTGGNTGGGNTGGATQGSALTNIPQVCPAPQASPVAHWDIVPFREFTGTLNVGVVAAHYLGIKEVRFWYTQSANYQQVFAGAPQVVVTARTTNPQNVATRTWGALQQIPQVPVREYWFPLNADAPGMTPNVPVRVKAEVVPNSTCPSTIAKSPENSPNAAEVMDHIMLTPNPSARQIYYADQSAAATNTACTQNEKCNSIAKVFTKITANAQAQGMGETLNRAEIRLGPSVSADWALTGFSSSTYDSALQTRWLIFRADDGVSPAQVRIRPGNCAWSVNLTSFQNVTIKEQACSTRNLNASPQFQRFDRRFVWGHQVGVLGDGYATIANGNSWDFASFYTWTGSYLTDSYMDFMTSGPRNVNLAQHVYGYRTGDGHASGSATVVNYTLHTSYGSQYNFGLLQSGLPVGPDYHGDYYQAWGRRGDFIIQGGRYDVGGILSLRGIVGTSPAIHSDIAIVDTVLDKSVASNPGSQWVFSFCAALGDGVSSGVVLNHITVEDSDLAGSSMICGESNPANFYAGNFLNIGYHNARWGSSSSWSTMPPEPWNLQTVYVYTPAGATP